jgi:Ca2+-binding RTX toxin-like protein
LAEDFLSGGEGTDYLQGDEGGDFLDGGADTDELIERLLGDSSRCFHVS